MQKKALFIGAHLDECEFGAGGTAYQLVRKGVRVRFLNPATFLHAGFDPDHLARIKKQDEAASAVLGVEKEVWMNETHETIWISDKKNILRIADSIIDFAPDMLFIQWPKDTHIEHVEVARASFKAICHAASYVHVPEVYAYEAGIEQTVQHFHPDFSIDISAEMDVLKECFRCYDFQNADGGALMREKQTVAHNRGYTHNPEHDCAYAEAFKIVKFPDGGNDFLLRRLLPDTFRWFGQMYCPAYARDYFD